MMAHAQGIHVREGQAKRALDLAVVLDPAVQLAADVLSGHLHPRQQAVDGFLQGLIRHEALPLLASACSGADSGERPLCHIQGPLVRQSFRRAGCA
jgi:hypothetical protein